MKVDQKTVDNICALTIAIIVFTIFAPLLFVNLPATEECQKLLVSEKEFAELQTYYNHFRQRFNNTNFDITNCTKNEQYVLQRYLDQKQYREICFNTFFRDDIPLLLERYQKEKAEAEVEILKNEIQKIENNFKNEKEIECQKVLLSDADFAELNANYTRIISSTKKQYTESERKIIENVQDQQYYQKICSISFPSRDVPLLIQRFQKVKAEKKVENLQQSKIEKNSNEIEYQKEAEKQKRKKLLAAFIKASENIRNGLVKLFGIQIDPFKQCLKNYNELVEDVAEIYGFKVE